MGNLLQLPTQITSKWCMLYVGTEIVNDLLPLSRHGSSLTVTFQVAMNGRFGLVTYFSNVSKLDGKVLILHLVRQRSQKK